MIHDLKTWPAMFQAVKQGYKGHEIRKNDRPYEVGDVLRLREWDPRPDPMGEREIGYTGEVWHVKVTFITPGGEWGIPADLCVMSIRDVI